MATRKAKAKQTAKQNRKPSVPKGYKAIGRAPSWDPEKNPVIEGVRGKAKEVTLNRDTDEEYTTETMIVNDDEIGPVTVWKSAMLGDIFEQTDDGDTVRIEFLGYGKAKKGQSAPKLFNCMVK